MPTPVTPIRVGVIGLSTQGWAATGLIPPMLALPQTPYKITGICTLNPKSPQQVEELKQKFGQELQVYGSPEDMAKADDIDLYVVTVKASDHKQAVLPALNAGIKHKKDIFLEWPATGNLEDSRAMAKRAEELGVRFMVGLQGRQGPTLKKVSQILNASSGEKGIGRIVSSCMIGCAPSDIKYWGPEVIETHRYITKPENNSSMLHVMVGHFLDPFLQMFGEISSITASQSVAFPKAKVYTMDGSPTSEVLSVTTPDTLSFSGVTKANVLFTFHCRAGLKLSAGRTNFLWIIDGTNGTVRLEGNGPASSFPNIAEPTLYLNGEKVEVPLEPLGNVGRAWTEIARGTEGDYATIRDAVKVHQVIQAVLDSANNGGQRLVD